MVSGTSSPSPSPFLVPILEEAQRRGFLGPRPVQGHIDHALRLVPVLPADGCGIDLGTGGGVPGLVLAWARPGLRWVFIESQERRVRWLREAVRRVGVADRVEVRQARAEAEGRGGLRHEAEVVTARSFAAPGVTAECAAPFLRPGARLWVAEPPTEDPGRWPGGPLAELGLKRLPAVVAGWVGLEQVAPAPDRYPRRVGIPGKRPLF